MEVQTVTVLKDRLQEALHELRKLAKKANRYGCPDIKVVVGAERVEKFQHRDWDGEDREIRVKVVDLQILGEAPRVGPYEFLARVELTPAGNLVDTKPGVEDLEERFRHTDGHCDHCHTDRQRKEVFAVRNTETGEQKQIGRQCLRDYLGIDNPSAVAHRFAFFRAVRDGFREGGWYVPYGQSIEALLKLASVCIRIFGWCSKTQASYDDRLTPTMAYVSVGLSNRAKLSQQTDREIYDRIHEALSDEDVATAHETIEWVRSLGSPDNDYLHNLTVIFAEDVVHDPKRTGLVVSAVAAMHRAKERELRYTKQQEAAKASEYQGEVGKRIRGLVVVQEESRVIGGNRFGDTVLVKFRDDAGNVYSWFTGKGTEAHNGERLTIDGTVREHKEFRGNKETNLTRVSVKARAA